MSTAVAAKGLKAQKTNVYAGLGDILQKGFDPVLQTDDQMIRISLDDIEVAPQVREEFEDEENPLSELGESLKVRQLQNIVVRPNQPGRGKRYLLVIGERRVRSAVASGQSDLWALVARMTDAEAEDAQFAENVQRKNLTQFEEARRIARDLEQLNGSRPALLLKYHKSQAWLSKRLSLLNLSPEARRAVQSNVTADVEVLSSLSMLEKSSPDEAKAVVEELRANRGKVKARDLVNAAKERVKAKEQKSKQETTVAAARDRSQEEPGEERVFAHAKMRSKAPPHEEPLARAYGEIFEKGRTPKDVLEALSDDSREAVEGYLATFYEAGKQAQDSARVVIEGFRNGGFATDGVGAFALVAYLHGTDGKAKFSLLNIFGAVKP